MSGWGRWGRAPAPAPPPPPPGSIDWLDSKLDPLPYLLRSHAYHPQRRRTSMILGVYGSHDDGHLYFHTSEPESCCFTIGQPRSTKTTGLLAPQALSHWGPLVVMSTKTDLAETLAVARSRSGRIWHLDAFGNDPLPGAIPLRLSFVQLASDWTEAQKLGAALTATTDPRHQFWSQQAGLYIAVPLLASHLAGGDMDLVVGAVRGSEPALDEMLDVLSGDEQGAEALDEWESIHRLHKDGIASIQMNAKHALRIFNRPGVRAQAADPNFDLVDFVRGDPYGISMLDGGGDVRDQALETQGIFPRPIIGSYDTVFITATSGDADQAQTIYRTFMRLLWETVQKVNREDKREGVTWRRPTLLIVDELANLAPDPNYPQMVSQAGDQGLLVSSAVQDLAFLEPHFGQATKGFLTIHRERLIYPGLSNADTTRTISELMGSEWEQREGSSDSFNYGGDKASSTSGTSQSDHRVPRLDPGQIRDGRPGDPKAMLYLPPDRPFTYLWPSPVWGARPWPRLLIACLEIQANKTMTGPDGTETAIAELPIPELDRVNHRTGQPILVETQPDGADLLRRWQAMRAHYGMRRAA